MKELDFSQLPELPQRNVLKEVAQRFWRNDEVVAIWLGGSFARDQADQYSDVDLRLAISTDQIAAYLQPDWSHFFGQPLLSSRTSLADEDALLHHFLLENCEVYDLWVQSPDRQLHNEPKLILGCRDDGLLERLTIPGAEERLSFRQVDPAAIRGAIANYWVNHVKTQKVIHRNLHMMWRDGGYLFTGLFLRLKFIEATGQDCGNVTVPPYTIHSISPILGTLHTHYGDDLLPIVAAGFGNKTESQQAIEQLSQAIGETGRKLARVYGFDYPDELEARVLASWRAFKDAAKDGQR